MKKSWTEKRDIDKKYRIKINPKKFADIPAGIKMLIPTPKIVIGIFPIHICSLEQTLTEYYLRKTTRQIHHYFENQSKL